MKIPVKLYLKFYGNLFYVSRIHINHSINTQNYSILHCSC